MHTEFWSENLNRKRPLGRPRHVWKDNIRIHLREIECEVVDQIINVAQERNQWWAPVDMVMNLWVQYKVENSHQLSDY